MVIGMVVCFSTSSRLP